MTVDYTEYNEGHASAQPIGPDVKIRPVRSLPGDMSNAERTSLKADEVSAFQSRGFLVKRGVLSKSETLTIALDYFWSKVPHSILQRDDPDTWLDSPHEKWEEEDIPNVGVLRGTNWKMRSPGPDGVGTESFLVDGIANHPAMIEIVSHFLGAPVKPASRVRGIYGVLPKHPDTNEKLHPHGDYMAAEISAMVLLHDTDPKSGSYTVWPGSHARMHMQWDKVHGSTIGDSNADGYRLTKDQILRDTDPVEFTGSAGDVIFWHPRMLHSAEVNCTCESNFPKVRIIVPCDYQRAGMTCIDNLEHGPDPVYQWWVDTRNTAEDVYSTPRNMWDRWGFARA